MSQSRRFSDIILSSKSANFVLLGVLPVYLTLLNFIKFILGTDGLLHSAWIILPLSISFFVLPFYLLNHRRGITWLCFSSFTLIIFVHFLLRFALSGLLASAVSFTTYGLWLGLFAWIQLSNIKDDTLFFQITCIVCSIILCLTSLIFYNNSSLSQAVHSDLFKVVTIGGVTRIYGISHSLTVAALQIGVGSICTFSLIRRYSTNRLIQSAFAAILIIQILALAITNSRGAFVGLFLVILALLSLHILSLFKSKKFALSKQFTYILYVFAAVLALIFFAYDLLVQSFSYVITSLSSDDLGNMGRFSAYSSSLNLLTEGPQLVFGFGAGTVSRLPTLSGNFEVSTESSLLTFLLETGFLGFIPVLILLLFIMHHAATKFNSSLFALSGILPQLLFIIFMAMTTEVLDTWIGSLYFTVSLALAMKNLSTNKRIFLFDKQ